MKTLDRKRVYLRGLLIGATVGLFLGSFLASWFASGKLHGRGLLDAPLVHEFDIYNAVFGGAWGLLGGLALGLGGAAIFLNLGSGEGREQAREAPAPVVFPGMFGNPLGDPFAPIKERIDAEEPASAAEPAPKAPATMPERCPSCGEKLEPAPGEEPSAFCYHCGGALG